MHVVVRVRVPVLGVRASYGLLGKVGKEPVRGNGLLAGNFSKKVMPAPRLTLPLMQYSANKCAHKLVRHPFSFILIAKTKPSAQE